MELKALLASQFVLPSIPKVVALLLSEFDRDEPDLKKITQLISTDPALTTRLLQLSNSGFFKLSGKISSVSESLAILDLGHVRTMRRRPLQRRLSRPCRASICSSSGPIA